MPRKFHSKPKPQSPIVSVAVHADIQNPTAFQLGFYHGSIGLKARKAESFIYRETASDYSLGFMAGCAARAQNKAV